MPSFRYRALTQSGELVSGSITAPTASEVANRIEYLGLVPIETITEARDNYSGQLSFSLLSRPRAEDVTVFTRDLALLLKAGARIDDALDLLALDLDIGRLRPVVAQIRGRVLAGESLSEALLHHPSLFPAMYVALVRVGETSGALDHVLDVLGSERNRDEAMRRKVTDALRYPAFVLFAACAVLAFFLLFVLPQFAAVLKDFNAKLDPDRRGAVRLVDIRARASRRHRSDNYRSDCLRLASASPRRGPRKDRRVVDAVAVVEIGRTVASHRFVLPEPGDSPWQRGSAHNDTPHSC